eukprot:snap_masked-scaffold619_size123246-processed-gene-0.10 protein:Tk05497 transcript:snap_masked-scaffold619_size123246-processed-gene-0.10-mRNA-1 annotation:"mitochondrial ribosomal protein l14"
MFACATRSVWSAPKLARGRALWRSADFTRQGAWPHSKPNVTHHRHNFRLDTYGVQSASRLRVVDNSAIGREAMAIGKPPKVIHVQSNYHRGKPHGAHGSVGDRVTVAIMGQVKHGIIVGLKVNQKAGRPRFDSNNVVLIDKTGGPLGTRIHAPIPNFIRPILDRKSHPKKADYTKILSIASRFV